MGSGCFGHQLRKTQVIAAFIILTAVFAVIGESLWAQDKAEEKPVHRSIVRKLKYIGADEAKDVLVSLGIGIDINKLSNMNALIITTCNTADRNKAASILTLIDSKVKYQVTKLASNPKRMPETDAIDKNIKGIEVGSFINPPNASDMPLAIVDVHNNDLIAVAPKGLLKPISVGFARAQKTFEEQHPITKPVKEMSFENALAAVENAMEPVIAIEKAEAGNETAATKDDKIQAAKPKEELAVAHKELSLAMKEFKKAEEQLAKARIQLQTDASNSIAEKFETTHAAAGLAGNDFISTGLFDTLKEAEKKEAEAEKKAENAAKEEKKQPGKAERKEPSQPVMPERKPPARRRPGITEHAVPVSPAPRKAGQRAVPVKTSARKPQPSKIDANPKAAQDDPELKQLLEILKAMEKDNTRQQQKKTTKLPGKTLPSEPLRPVPETSVKRPPAVKSKPETGKVSSKPQLTEAELETTITLPTKVQIPELLKLVGMQLGLNYMYDPAHVKGEVTLFINDGGKIKVGELYNLVESALKFKGFVMARNGKLVTVVPQSMVTNIDPRILKNGEGTKEGDVAVIRVFKLKNIDTATAEKMLTEMKLGISIQSIPENSTMIITGYAYRMDRIQEVLDMIDLPGKKRQFRDRTLMYTTPSALAPKLESLARELGTVSISISSKGATAGPTPVTSKTKTSSSAAARAKALADARARAAKASSHKTKTTSLGTATQKGVYLDIDDRTNRILMIGLAESIEIVEGLIDTLDIKQQGLKVIRQYQIENVDASMVIDILSELGVTAGVARPVAPTNSKTKTPVTSTRGANSGEGPQISLLTATNSLLINATPEQHDDILTVIAHVDVENPDERVIKEYEIESVDTTEIIDTLAELGIISTQTGRSSSSRYSANSRSASTRSQTGTTARPTTATPAAPSSFSEPLADEPQIAVLETTNSLLVNATSKQHASIAMVIAHVDRELTESSTPYIIYPLENQDPEELKPLLDELVNATIAAKTQTKAPAAGAPTSTSKIQSTQKSSSGLRDEDERITIVADAKTYSLVVYASKKNQLWIGNMIKELDAYRPQVLLDVTLVEITKDDGFTFHLDLVSKAAGFASGGTMESGKIPSLLSPFPGSQILEASSIKGNGKAFFADKHVQALLDVVDKKGFGRVLARPKILVNDNELGSIKSEEIKYVIREETVVIPGTTQGTSNTQTKVNFESFDAGIQLDIEPHISKGDLLRLKINLIRKDFRESKDTIIEDGDTTRTVPTPPETVSSNVETVVTAPNGTTVILGGLETIKQNKQNTKVPILGDIPLIGGLFRGVDNTDIQSRLYVFIKPYILRPGDETNGLSDIKKVSDKNRKSFEELEAKFQGLEDFPGLKPQPMDPLRILDEDEEYNAQSSRKVIRVNKR